MAKSKKAIVSGNIARWYMSVKGGDLPENFEVFMDVEMDFENAPRASIIEQCSGGQSIRVKLQDRLRALPTTLLRQYEVDGYKCKFIDIYNAMPVAKPVDTLLAMEHDEFIATMIDELGMEREQAERIYAHKHGLEYTPAPVEPNGIGEPIDPSVDYEDEDEDPTE